jgi:hypothetical protein
MLPDSRRHELERQLLDALRQDVGTPAQWLMAPGVQEGLQQLFLSLSDAVLQPLLEALAQWQADPAALPSEAVLGGLRQLRGLAQDRRLSSIEALVEGLHQALLAARQSDPLALSPADCQQGAEELARLLFLYAAGQQREASPDVLALLQT